MQEGYGCSDKSDKCLERVKVKNVEKVSRRPDIDILRVTLNWLILVFHIAVAYSPYYLFFPKDPEIDGSKLTMWREGIFKLVVYLDGWCMPLFFFISGVSAYLALSRRTEKEYRAERVHRLIAPTLFMMSAHIHFLPALAFVPVTPACQLYFNGKETTEETGKCLMLVNPHIYSDQLGKDEKLKWVTMRNRLIGSPQSLILPFIKQTWFCIYLFVYSQILAGTFIKCHPSHGENSKQFVDRIIGVFNHPVRLAVLPGLCITIVEITLRQDFPNFQFWFFSIFFDWANNLNYIIIYFLGFALTAADANGLANLLAKQQWVYFLTGSFLLFFRSPDPTPWLTLNVDNNFLSLISRCVSRSFGEWLTVLGVYSISRSRFRDNQSIPMVLREMAMPFYLIHLAIQLLVMKFTFTLSSLMPALKSFPVNILICTIVTATISYLITKLEGLRYYFGLPPTEKSRGKGGFTSILVMSIILAIHTFFINLT